MYCYMSLCNIPLLTSLEPLHGFSSNFVWMFLGWTPTKFVKIIDQKSFIYLVLKVPRDLISSLFCTYIYSFN